MSIQELEHELSTIPLKEVARLHRLLEARLSAETGGDGSPEHITTEESARSDESDLRALAAAAGGHWQGGDGLAFQRHIRAEWDDRPTLGR